MQAFDQLDLKPFNTFGIPVKARWLIRLEAQEELEQIPELLQIFGNGLPPLILGGGSNILFTQDVIPLILQPAFSEIEIMNQDDQWVWIRAGAGVVWDQLVEFSVARNWGGLENLSLIPGSVGACPIQNIGAYGTEAGQAISQVEVIDMLSFQTRTFNRLECQFGYRSSIFKTSERGRFLIHHVTFRLSKRPTPNLSYGQLKERLHKSESIDIQHVRDVVIEIRKEKLPDPKDLGNAGSFFKNPVVSSSLAVSLRAYFPEIPMYSEESGDFKIPAGWLIEKAGLKGWREGSCGTFEKQALILVNYGEASGKKVLETAEKIRERVFQTFHIPLEFEVNIFP